jgi:alanyl-tRNA synthetase
VIESGTALFEVDITKKPVDGLHVHVGKVVRGNIKVGDPATATVDEDARKAIARNHTATHILHAALKQVLGDHVKQAGSLVAPGRLRFDYSHFAPMSMRERERVEDIVNQKGLAAMAVGVQEMDTEKAISGGATALFGEKYGKSVRVVKMGDYSTELCGGTHLHNSAEVGLFKLISETGVAAGVRRIEALTGEGALSYVRSEEDELREVAAIVKASDAKVADKVARLNDRAKELEKELEKLKSKMAGEGAGDLVSQAREISGVKVIASVVGGLDMKSLRDMADGLRDKLGSGVVALGSDGGGKVSLVCMVTKDLVDRLRAGDIIKEAAAIVGGSGGGRPDMAQAGGKDPSRLPEAMEKACEVVASALG